MKIDDALLRELKYHLPFYSIPTVGRRIIEQLILERNDIFRRISEIESERDSLRDLYQSEATTALEAVDEMNRAKVALEDSKKHGSDGKAVESKFQEDSK